MTEIYEVDAAVHMPLSKGFRVKANIRGLGIYINGIVVFPPDAKSDKWEFRSPATKDNKSGKWSSLIEFDTKMPLWKELTSVCFQAVQDYIEQNNYRNLATTRDEVIEDIDDEPINWDAVNIPS